MREEWATWRLAKLLSSVLEAWRDILLGWSVSCVLVIVRWPQRERDRERLLLPGTVVWTQREILLLETPGREKTTFPSKTSLRISPVSMAWPLFGPPEDVPGSSAMVKRLLDMCTDTDHCCLKSLLPWGESALNLCIFFLKTTNSLSREEERGRKWGRKREL